MAPLRIGFIGLGGICRQRHVPGLLRQPDIAFTAVANRGRASAEAAAREFGIPQVLDSWEEVVARDDVDAVLIGTWPYLHRDISVAALAAGKHVFCQARMAMNLAEALEMRDAARRADRVAMLCPVPFGLSVDRAVARLLAEDALGAVRSVRVMSLNGAWTDPEAPMTWRKDHRLSGLNMQTLGMHAEVLHRWFGPTRSVSAQAAIHTPERRDLTGEFVEVRIPDQVSVNAVLGDGILAQYLISGVAPFPRESLEVIGEKAALFYDIDRDFLSLTGPDGAATPVEIRPEEAYDVRQWRVEEDFVRAVREGAEYHPDFDDGVRYMQVVQAVADSAESGETVELEDLG